MKMHELRAPEGAAKTLNAREEEQAPGRERLLEEG